MLLKTIRINYYDYYDRGVEKCQANCLMFVASAPCNSGRNGYLGISAGKHVVSNRVNGYRAFSVTLFEGIIG